MRSRLDRRGRRRHRLGLRGVRLVDHPSGVLQGRELHTDELLGLFSDEALAEHHATQSCDRVEQWPGPTVLHQDQGQARTRDQRLHQSLGSHALQHLDATALEHGEHIEGVELGAGDQQVAEVLVRDLHAHQ